MAKQLKCRNGSPRSEAVALAKRNAQLAYEHGNEYKASELPMVKLIRWEETVERVKTMGSRNMMISYQVHRIVCLWWW
jgi:hypothetical protein